MDVAPGGRRPRAACSTTPSGRSGRSPSRRGSTFELELEPTAPPTLVTDEQRLQQVLKNLLSNAFKFTDAGTVALPRRHRAGRRALRERRRCSQRRRGRRVRGRRHRHRDPARQAAPDLRGVPAGRRDDEPALRRHRASASRSAARSRACSAARSTPRARRARAARSRSTCRRSTSPPPERRRPPTPRGRARQPRSASEPAPEPIAVDPALLAAERGRATTARARRRATGSS